MYAKCAGLQSRMCRHVFLLKTNLRACDLPPNELENLTADRSSWRSSFKKQVSDFERRRILSDQDKRVQRKTGRQLSLDCGFSCDTCSHVCASRIGLISHQRTHLWSRDQSCGRLIPTTRCAATLSASAAAFLGSARYEYLHVLIALFAVQW